MRLIDADALIYKLYNEVLWGKEWDEVLALLAVTDAPTIDPVAHGKWMPCSERLPSETERVLITVRHTNEAEDEFYEITLDFICQGKWYKHGFFDNFNGEDVVAWMSLPEPYKEGAHE